MDTEPQTPEPETTIGPTSEQPTPPATDLTQPIAWQATEGPTTHRPAAWYIIFVVVVLGLMALSLFVFKSWTFTILLPIMAVALALLATKPASLVNYAISPKGVYVADKLHDFSEFRAFGLMRDGQQHAAILLPVKRFSPALTIYFSEAEGEAIVDMLGSRLPMQEVKPDALEKFIRAIKL